MCVTITNQMLRISDRRVWRVPPPSPCYPILLFFSLKGRWPHTGSGSIQYLYVSFCLVSTAERRWTFMCRICHSSIRASAFLKCWKREPSVELVCFIKWQSGSFYFANVSCGGWLPCVFEGVCVLKDGDLPHMRQHLQISHNAAYKF